MGCAASKLDNEDTVQRCKERRRLMKEAVFARHHLSAAHADYCRSLRVTGSALADFAANEPLAVAENTPAVLLRNASTQSFVSNLSLPVKPPPIKVQQPTPATRAASLPPYSPAPSSVYPPPPPPHLHRHQPSPSPSPTVRSSNLPHILSASSVQSSSRKGNSRKQPKLPHILSDSSPAATPTTVKSASFYGKFDYPTYEAHSAYASTPSQASSVWNWENFYPPPPPDSELFHSPTNNQDAGNHHPESPVSNPSTEYSKFQKHQPDHHQHHHLDVDEEEEVEEEEEREEVHCSEWGDHYSTTSSDSDDVDADVDDERETRSEMCGLRSRSDFGSSVHNQSFDFPRPNPPLSTSSKYKIGKEMKTLDEKSEDGASSSVSWDNANTDMRMVVRHRDLKEIVASIKDYFDQAGAAGDKVSEMLETGRAQLDRNFRQLKKTVYHSTGVLSNLSSSWTSKPPLAVKYRLDACSLDESGGPKSLCSTLERLLAWEKKLYEEVKAREGVKIEHEKKLSTLQSQEYKGEDETKLDKTKSSLKKLQSLIIVTSQAVNTTSAAIVGVRDSDLIPQLVELCHGFMYMWRAMNQFHELQHQVVQQVRGLVNRSAKGHSTSELHRQATRDLESAVSAWHSSFCRIVKYQRDFGRSLHSWFKLSLLPVENEANNATREHSDAYSFLDEWKLALDRLPDTVASGAIKSFVNVVHVISMKQSEEIKIKKRTDTVSKELEKKASALRSIEKKYYNSYSMVGLGLPESGPDSGHVLDARDPLAEKKSELTTCQRRVEEEMLKHSMAVEVTRAMTLNNIQTGLPGVFQAMTSFSSLFTEALETVCTRSYAIK